MLNPVRLRARCGLGNPWFSRLARRRSADRHGTAVARLVPVAETSPLLGPLAAAGVRDGLQPVGADPSRERLETLGRLAAGIAHDFNNIMTAIMGYSELLLDADLGPKLRDHVREIVDAADKASALNRQLMAFSRRQAGEPRVVDFRLVVSGVERLLRRLIGEAVRIVVDLPPDLGRVKADPAQLEQVVMNLAVNARDAMPRGGVLTLRLADAGTQVLLEVRDTGDGMDRATCDRIFEPFFSTKPEGRGTGLGLATVDAIVRRSGGRVEVESQPGEGTTFRVWLPRVDEPLDAGERVIEAAPPRGHETVLIVEDEIRVRSLMRETLEGCGYRVLDAARPAAALELGIYYASPIHLLVADLVLPEMSGSELWATLSMRRPGLKVLFVSGYPDEPGLEAIGSGAALLEKPFTRAAVARRVREALDGPGFGRAVAS